MKYWITHDDSDEIAYLAMLEVSNMGFQLSHEAIKNQFTKPKTRFFSVHHQTSLCGFVRYCLYDNGFYIESLQISRAYQKAMVFKHIINELKRISIGKKLTLDVDSQSIELIRIYKRLGFNAISEKNFQIRMERLHLPSNDIN